MASHIQGKELTNVGKLGDITFKATDDNIKHVDNINTIDSSKCSSELTETIRRKADSSLYKCEISSLKMEDFISETNADSINSIFEKNSTSNTGLNFESTSISSKKCTKFVTNTSTSQNCQLSLLSASTVSYSKQGSLSKDIECNILNDSPDAQKITLEGFNLNSTSPFSDANLIISKDISETEFKPTVHFEEKTSITSNDSHGANKLDLKDFNLNSVINFNDTNVIISEDIKCTILKDSSCAGNLKLKGLTTGTIYDDAKTTLNEETVSDSKSCNLGLNSDFSKENLSIDSDSSSSENENYKNSFSGLVSDSAKDDTNKASGLMSNTSENISNSESRYLITTRSKSTKKSKNVTSRILEGFSELSLSKGTVLNEEVNLGSSVLATKIAKPENLILGIPVDDSKLSVSKDIRHKEDAKLCSDVKPCKAKWKMASENLFIPNIGLFIPNFNFGMNINETKSAVDKKPSASTAFRFQSLPSASKLESRPLSKKLTRRKKVTDSTFKTPNICNITKEGASGVTFSSVKVNEKPEGMMQGPPNPHTSFKPEGALPLQKEIKCTPLPPTDPFSAILFPRFSISNSTGVMQSPTNPHPSLQEESTLSLQKGMQCTPLPPTGSSPSILSPRFCMPNPKSMKQGPPDSQHFLQQQGPSFMEKGIQIIPLAPTKPTPAVPSPKFAMPRRKDAITRCINKLLKGLEEALDSGKHSDVTLNVQGKEFNAHKLILAIHSPVFSAMLEHDTKEKATGVVDIPDCEPNTFSDFLYFLYTGSTRKLTVENAMDLYTIADKYQVIELCKNCVNYMYIGIALHNFCKILTFALQYDEKELIRAAKQFFIKNSKEITATVEWISFTKENPVVSNDLFVKALKFCKK